MEQYFNNRLDSTLSHEKGLSQLTKSQLIHLIQDGSYEWWFSIHEFYGIPRNKRTLEKKYNYDVLLQYEQLFTRRTYDEYTMIVAYLNYWNSALAGEYKKWTWWQMAQLAEDICQQNEQDALHDFSSKLLDLFTEMLHSWVWMSRGMQEDYSPIETIFEDLQVFIQKQSYSDLYSYFIEYYDTLRYSLRAEEVWLLIEKIERLFAEPYETIVLLQKMYDDIRDDEYNKYNINF